MLIAPNSLLRKVPESLGDRMRLFIDGIRFSLQMADIAFRRVIHSAQRVSVTTNPESQTDPEGHAVIFLDAWAVIDNVYRLKTLVHQLPSTVPQEIKQLKEVFLRSEIHEKIEGLRHFVQHLPERYAADADKKMPWGVLGWVEMLQPNIARIWVMRAGNLNNENLPFVDLQGKIISARIDHVELTIHDQKVSLSETLRIVESFKTRLETEWTKYIQDKEADCPGADLLGSAEMHFDAPMK